MNPSQPNDLSHEPSLAAALLPVLLHRVRNTTQLLTGLSSLFALGDPGLAELRSGDLAEASRRSEELGWLLGVISCGIGADVLLARREKNGLAPMIELVRDGLRREERELEWRRWPPPEIDPRAGWEVCWTVGTLLWSAGRSLPKGARLACELSSASASHELRGDAGSGPALATSAREAMARIAGSRFAPDRDAWTFVFPDACLRAVEA